ncbi:protein kinase domain-containing protein [Tuwongella immobilis]|uniref:PPM-type phosphatase domain-containing protein n=1 Tax=Tuwongella immobilis TaxID=692036 RepID=A0A6C2YP18_9BACT|nr:protein phosphatase 2C domain-containing protein [Tuwongella immobilis]VIP02632.1 protein serine threonine phosphatase : Protein phosphatase OS=uncultured planctomycete GN=HGMM_F12C05C22 PE=4 SV=1: Pkinase: PP2C [Tuwongella immobilis]VTS01984.1 protein serine threonine phosphatase : Protein phosphatase OS=uncultured planctomycete GN=HGMM_F12C05C22 PE=4 SV=1: Pkinase: PP2C [Tuwongella immobilis]
MIVLANRYVLDACLWEFAGTQRFRAWDRNAGGPKPVEVRIIRAKPLSVASADSTPPANPTSVAETTSHPVPTVASELESENTTATAELPVLSNLPEPSLANKPTVRMQLQSRSNWPHPDWERAILDQSPHRQLPGVIDSFTEGEFVYLVEEYPTGRPLLEAWHHPESSSNERFTWLLQLASAIRYLHRNGLLAQGIRPEWVVIAADGRAVIREIADFLPLPLPRQLPPRDSLYDAPELRIAPSAVEPRSDLYSFGALIYSLYQARPLMKSDFISPGNPRNFLEQFPEASPLIGRLIGKTFRSEIPHRFPTPATALEDASGFRELIHMLEVCRRRQSGGRFEIAAHSSTGMVRSGNEDAIAVLHTTEGRLDDVEEKVVILLADGMGGMECGEIAAGMAIQSLRTLMLQNPPLGTLVNGGSPFRSAPSSMIRTTPTDVTPLNLQNRRRTPWDDNRTTDSGSLGGPEPIPQREDRGQVILEAMREVNRRIYHAAREGYGVQGMGCTAEVVLIEDDQLYIGHVGDSRVYLFRQGKLMQLTRDQTLVQRLVELGRITPEEAENHPRRAELQQALGGRPEVEPDLVFATLRTNDWLLVCSDGLTNAVKPEQIAAELTAARGAEAAARRLINRANLANSNDNVSLIVVRVFGG